jgi:hypothetical protein
MKSHFHSIPLFLLCAAFASAEPPGIDQSLEFVAPPTGSMFIRWHGKPGRTYFIMVSDPADHLRAWRYAPHMEAGNDVEISYEVNGTADKGFFRLLYTDEPVADPYLADFDNDGIPNSYEIETVGSDPFNKNSAGGDSDTNGLPDGWEMYYFGGLGIADPEEALQPDGLTNKDKAELGLNPNTDYSDANATQPAAYTYDLVGRLTGVTAPVGTASFTPDDEGNILNAQ